MKRARGFSLGLAGVMGFLGLLGLTPATLASGLIIIHGDDFWISSGPHPHPHPPRRIVPIPHPPPTPRPPRPRPHRPSWAPLEIRYSHAAIDVKGQLAVTSIDEEFYNPNPRRLEGTFLFPVPKGAHIDKFTMEINGKQVEAELLTAKKARGIYEQIVRKLKDPALLEYAGRDLFKVRIFPIEPHKGKKITLKYTQLLKSDGGLVNLVFPLNTEKYSAQPIRNVSVKVDLKTDRPLKSIYSPSHAVEIKRHGPKRATIGYEGRNLKPDADFQLFYTQEEGDLGVNLLTHKVEGKDGYFALLASPGAEVKSTRILPKDVAFVLDTSGSMAGDKLAQAKKALLFCVENLNEKDRFEVLRFSTEVEPLFEGLTGVADKSRKQAREFIGGLKPIGGTAIDDALQRALALRPDDGDRPYVVIFLTDGRPTVGDTDLNHIVGHVKKSNRGHVRVFCFGIGTDVNTHLLDRITEETKAFSQYVLPKEDLELKVSAFFTKIKEPVLANPEIRFPDGVRVTKLYPSPLPDLFKGEQLVVVGRYSGSGHGAIQITGKAAGEEKRFAYDVDFGNDCDANGFIPRLWATRRVGYLLDEIRLRGESAELKDEVTQLARNYNIVTPYTAYLIVEDEGNRGIARRDRSLNPADGKARRQLEAYYGEFKNEQSGGKAIAGARASVRLKQAAQANDAIALGNDDVLSLAKASESSGLGGGGGARLNGFLTSTAPRTADPFGLPAQAREERARGRGIVSGESRFVGGRTFYRNSEAWVDGTLQAHPKAKQVRVQFGSKEYFDLLRKDSRVLRWLSLGRAVRFVLDGVAYEIFE